MNKKHKIYVPLHGHSSYSINDGVARIDDIFKRAKEINAPAIALTEHGNMSSFYKFYNASKNTGIKPIMGCELYLNDGYFYDRDNFFLSKKRKNDNSDGDADNSDEDNLDNSNYSNSHILAYAKNYDGLKNIIHLSNIGFSNFYRKPMISSDHLFDNLDENNIVTTACLASKFNRLIIRRQFKEATELLIKYKEKFGDDFYIELHVNELEEQTLVNNYYKRIAPKIGIKFSLALDYHYVYKEDWETQYLMYVIKSRKTVRSMPLNDWFYKLRDLYIKSIDEVYNKAEKLGYDDYIINEAIESTLEISDKISVEIPKYQNNFPKYTSSKEESEQIFDEKVNLKWEEKISNGLIPKDKIEAYRQRLSYEIDIIKSKDVVDYFLIIDDLLNNFVYKVGGNSGAGRGCFTPDMLVSLHDGSQMFIEDIKIGDIVKNFYNKKSKVIDKLKYNIEENLLELEFDDGRIIKCTKDHKILTDKGWIEAQYLIESHNIINI